MPLDFVEEEKAPAPVEFFAKDTKVKPQHLETEVIPELIRRVGNVKSQQFSIAMVEQYLQRSKLIFEPKLLKEMFEEADYKDEGYLEPRTLAAAIGGRYPKRKLTADWRNLASLLLEVPELVLTQDIVDVKQSKNVVSNCNLVWGDQPPELPGKRLPPGWRAESSTPLAKETPSAAPSAEETAWVNHLLGVGPPVEEGTEPPRMPMVPSTLLSPAPAGRHATFCAAGNTQTARDDTSAPPQDASALAAEMTESSAKSCSATSKPAFDPWAVAPAKGLKAWNAALPPSGITLSATALSQLRTTVKSTLQPKPGFVTMLQSTGTGVSGAKVCMGEQMDLCMSLARVEPTRPTHIKPGASFCEWGDYASNCRTAPSKWFNEHPAVPVAAKVPCKYPWGGADV
uniref:EF-hand domain-containing protein n=1 Tax=Chlamydomonas euryale TaxID=1486919 RepID=A0A7R9V4H7_9CHLO|mmetsp:Transcript_17671/g.53048  ORF Transcript_17671/g.53048 Transcript_17671/m.53048 type:complete len:399 (+) Transcript_17671:270-1466(+)